MATTIFASVPPMSTPSLESDMRMSIRKGYAALMISRSRPRPLLLE
jgi:hypothetical protein